MKLKVARQMASKVYQDVQQGIYPHDERNRRIAAQKAAQVAQDGLGSVEQLFLEYIECLEYRLFV